MAKRGESYWRAQATPVIERVLRETAGKYPSEVRIALRKAYPFGHPSGGPCKIWNDEIARQQGRPMGTRKPPTPEPTNPDQIDLFTKE